MSAFLCSEQHVGALVRFWFNHDRYATFRGVELKYTDWREVFTVLTAENARSMVSRYGSRLEPLETTGHTPTAPELDAYPKLEPVAVLKCVKCYQYQACESDDWPSTEAHALSEQILDAAIDALPGYDAAPWGL